VRFDVRRRPQCRFAGSDGLRDFYSYNRSGLETDYVPAAFSEIRLALRLIDPMAERVGTQIRDTEKQGVLQFHFYY